MKIRFKMSDKGKGLKSPEAIYKMYYKNNQNSIRGILKYFESEFELEFYDPVNTVNSFGAKFRTRFVICLLL